MEIENLARKLSRKSRQTPGSSTFLHVIDRTSYPSHSYNLVLDSEEGCLNPENAYQARHGENVRVDEVNSEFFGSEDLLDPAMFVERMDRYGDLETVQEGLEAGDGNYPTVTLERDGETGAYLDPEAV